MIIPAIIVGILLALVIAIDKNSDRRKRANFLRRHEAILQESNEFTSDYQYIVNALFEEKLGVSKPVFKNKASRPARILVRVFLHYKDQEALLGDLAELYEVVLKEEGKKAAITFYYSQVIRSILAQFKRIGFFALIGAFIKHIIS